MAHADLSQMIAQVAADTTVMGGAETCIRGFAAATQAAIDAALENGATAAELAPVQDVVDAQVAKAVTLAEAIATVPAA